MHAVAIIPARGGSQRIPNKNIKDFLGKPIISYAIRTALGSGVFDRVIVSTDSESIADVARRFGAEVPFLRCKELADSVTPTAPVLLDAVKFMKGLGWNVDFVCCIYPTAPFVQPRFLQEGYDRLVQLSVSSAVSVVRHGFPVLRSHMIDPNGFLRYYFTEHELTRGKDIESIRSNDLPELYHDAGQFYWERVDTFLARPKLFHPDTLPVILPRYLVQDIDTNEDWLMAELKYEACQKRGLL